MSPISRFFLTQTDEGHRANTQNIVKLVVFVSAVALLIIGFLGLTSILPMSIGGALATIISGILTLVIVSLIAAGCCRCSPIENQNNAEDNNHASNGRFNWPMGRWFNFSWTPGYHREVTTSIRNDGNNSYEESVERNVYQNGRIDTVVRRNGNIVSHTSTQNGLTRQLVDQQQLDSNDPRFPGNGNRLDN